MRQFGLGMLFASLIISILVPISRELAAPALLRFHLQCAGQDEIEIYLSPSQYWVVDGRLYTLSTALCEIPR